MKTVLSWLYDVCSVNKNDDFIRRHAPGQLEKQAFEKCWAHSPLRAAARRLYYIAIHQVSLLSHAACASMSTMTTTTTTTTTTRDRGDRYGPIEWAKLAYHYDY